MTDDSQVRDIGHNETRCEDCALFSLCFAQELSTEERDLLNRVLQRQQPLDRNEHLYHGGQPMKSITVVRSGSVKAYQLSHEGDEIVSGFYLPGEIIGLDALAS
ncbi:MAG: cyclic nucleotide-binding domain-containing protein [Wenzhouxiangella sp.]|nr:cyclic nucleotide-binding domain-containing protein [Wenzhouxiangella sp.]